MRWLFTGIAVLCCGILIPVNIAYNLRNVDEKNRDLLSILTIRDVQGNWLLVHVAASYLVTLLVCGHGPSIAMWSVSHECWLVSPYEA